jgi:UDP-glucose 4-epimerase
VSDLASAHVAAHGLAKGNAGQPINLGNGRV